MIRIDGRRRGSGGFSLIEVMIAVTILGVGLLAVTGAQIHALRGGSYGKHSAQAGVIANSQMEILKRTHWDNLAPTAWTAPQNVNIQVESPGGMQVEQVYAVQWRISDVVAGQTRSIDVRVQWNEPERPNRSLTYSSLRFNVEQTL
jgi:prepilin-type N-terminal cleavage/methylation domain-containing protein